MTAAKPCTRCLLEEAGKGDIYAMVQRCIAKLPENQRTAPQEYERRLKLCGECEHISGGTCLKCGCYVQLRAAKAEAHCPLKKRAW